MDRTYLNLSLKINNKVKLSKINLQSAKRRNKIPSETLEAKRKNGNNIKTT